MKKSLSVVVLIAIVTMVILPGCNKPEANTKEEQARIALEKEVYLADIEIFKKESYKKMAANEIAIAKFEDQIGKLAKEEKSDYNRRIFTLSQTNQHLEDRLNNYKPDGNEDWKIFKTEFARDLKKLGDDFKEFSMTNEKSAL